MEVVVRIAAVALLATAVSLLLRRRSAELAIPLAAAVCVLAFTASLTLLRPVRSLLAEIEAMSGLSAAYFMPVLKCIAIGLAAKTGADLCRDGGQSALAGAVEFAGTAAALFVSLPLLRSFLALLRELL